MDIKLVESLQKEFKDESKEIKIGDSIQYNDNDRYEDDGKVVEMLDENRVLVHWNHLGKTKPFSKEALVWSPITKIYEAFGYSLTTEQINEYMRKDREKSSK
jgi:hypothetical protein